MNKLCINTLPLVIREYIRIPKNKNIILLITMIIGMSLPVAFRQINYVVVFTTEVLNKRSSLNL